MAPGESRAFLFWPGYVAGYVDKLINPFSNHSIIESIAA
jgi:hypothetical protein